MKISRDFSLQSSLLIHTGYVTLKLWVENSILQLEKMKMTELVSFEEVALKTKTGSGTTLILADFKDDNATAIKWS